MAETENEKRKKLERARQLAQENNNDFLSAINNKGQNLQQIQCIIEVICFFYLYYIREKLIYGTLILLLLLLDLGLIWPSKDGWSSSISID